MAQLEGVDREQKPSTEQQAVDEDRLKVNIGILLRIVIHNLNFIITKELSNQ